MNPNVVSTKLEELNAQIDQDINFRRSAFQAGLIVEFGVAKIPDTGENFLFRLPAASIAMAQATPDRVFNLVVLAHSLSPVERDELLDLVAFPRSNDAPNVQYWAPPFDNTPWKSLYDWLEGYGKPVEKYYRESS